MFLRNLIGLSLAIIVLSCSGKADVDILIQNGIIYDGTGNNSRNLVMTRFQDLKFFLAPENGLVEIISLFLNSK